MLVVQLVHDEHHLRGPGRKYGTPVSGWSQQLVSRTGVPGHSPRAGPVRSLMQQRQAAAVSGGGGSQQRRRQSAVFGGGGGGGQ